MLVLGLRYEREPTPGREADVDAIVARACRRPELLLLGALLHDISKGMRGDHSEVGEKTAEHVVRRMGFESEAREILPWLVRNHLLMAEVATRRALSEKMLRMAPARAGEIIVRAVERRRARVLVGGDAQFIAALERLVPVRYWRVLARMLPR